MKSLRRALFFITLIVLLIGAGMFAWVDFLYSTLSPIPSPIVVSATTPPTTTATPQDVCIVEVTEALNLRSGAGMEFTVKDWLKNGDVLTLTGNQNASWMEVITSSGARGWINSNFCKRGEK